MTKKRTNVSINKEVRKKARKHGINIRNFLEIKLCEHIALMGGKASNKQEVFLKKVISAPTGI